MGVKIWFCVKSVYNEVLIQSKEQKRAVNWLRSETSSLVSN